MANLRFDYVFRARSHARERRSVADLCRIVNILFVGGGANGQRTYRVCSDQQPALCAITRQIAIACGFADEYAVFVLDVVERHSKLGIFVFVYLREKAD